MSIQPPLFHHLPLEPSIISRAFSQSHFHLPAPLGSATFLSNCSPLVLALFMASSQCRTLAAVCPWEVHPLASGRVSPSVLPSYKKDAFGITAFCAAAVGLSHSLHLLTQGWQTALAWEKPDGWSGEMGVFIMWPQNPRIQAGLVDTGTLQQEKSLNVSAGNVRWKKLKQKGSPHSTQLSHKWHRLGLHTPQNFSVQMNTSLHCLWA